MWPGLSKCFGHILRRENSYSFIHSSGTGTMLGGGDTRISKIDRHDFSHSLQYSDNVLTSSTHPVSIFSSG